MGIRDGGNWLGEPFCSPALIYSEGRGHVTLQLLDLWSVSLGSPSTVQHWLIPRDLGMSLNLLKPCGLWLWNHGCTCLPLYSILEFIHEHQRAFIPYHHTIELAKKGLPPLSGFWEMNRVSQQPGQSSEKWKESVWAGFMGLFFWTLLMGMSRDLMLKLGSHFSWNLLILGL